MEHQKLIQDKRVNLYIILCCIFISSALVAELIGGKIFSFEKTFGLPFAQIPIFGKKFDINLTAGVVVWPVVFITTDIINEYFGKKGVRKVSLLTVSCIIFAFIVIWISTKLSPANFWVNLYGDALDINSAYTSIFMQGTNIIFASIVAFLIGQLLDAIIFQKFKRVTGSTLISQLIDSFIVIFVAFYFLSEKQWTLEQAISVSSVNYIYKFFIAILITPVIYLGHYLIKLYLGKEDSEKMIKEAGDHNFF